MVLTGQKKWLKCITVCDLLFFLLLISLTNGGSGFSTVQLGPKPIWNATHVDVLKQDLLLNYDKFARPTQHYNLTNVQIGLSIIHLEVNELKSMISVNGWLSLEWTDEKLKWNPDSYGGIKKLNFADHEIWQPDVLLYNSATPNTHFGGTHCVVNSNGNIIWVPPVILNALCEFDLKYWPFDTQKCYLKFGSWTYHGEEIDMNIDELRKGIQLEDMVVKNNAWDITQTDSKKNLVYYKCCMEPYTDVTFTLTLSRKSPSYKALIITPAIVIMLLTLSSYWLPPQSGEKVVLNGVTAIIICIFMLYFTSKLPAIGSNVPSVVCFYSTSLYIVCFSMIAAVVVLWLSRTKHNRQLPWKIKSFLTGPFGRHALGLNFTPSESNIRGDRAQVEEMREQQATEFEEHNSNDDHHMIQMIKLTKSHVQNDWILLAVAIDTFLFYLFTFVFIILAIVCLI
ncbi:acetylcholine receptor subunit alpha-like 1 [Agrilus planipennis]|uniref:Acetylcholine receptor subunit alpha-like 1 n=1 Tax=Agrilus planipennis TaxID=224129 RepID=A0A1W4X4Y2_AGRPL|nr:acetylcholine receptor subunit alpha-like 1 [Agrilus planipennis]